MRNKKIKGLILGTILGISILSPAIQPINIVNAEHYDFSMAIRGHSQITISNARLRQEICSILGKNYSSTLYADDFKNHADFKLQTITDPETGITTTKANKNCLDLSYTGIKDIRELCQFDFPETMKSINLMGNGITNEDLPNIVPLFNLTQGQTIEINGVEYSVNSNFNNIFKKVNLNLNNINLDSLSSELLNNSTLLFGIQNLNENSNELYEKSEIENTKYYIRSTDNLYLSYNFKYNTNTLNFVENTISPLCENMGEYIINISNPPSSESGYFYELNKTINLFVFSAKIKDSYSVERNQIFDLTENDIEINGLYENYKVRPHNASTNTIDPESNYVRVDIEYREKTKSLSLPFRVVDTIKPVITLEGYDVIYWRKNKTFVDPGYSAKDSGDDISAFVETTSNLDITHIGDYEIRYNVTDLAGNSAEEKIRRILVQESVLDNINIKVSKTDYKVGEEITLTVRPDENTPTNKYGNFEYHWYLNGVKFKESKGDSISGQSSISFITDSTQEKYITVKLYAKQLEDDRMIVVSSEEFVIKANNGIAGNKSIIIAGSVAVGLIFIAIIIGYILKNRKAVKKTSKVIRTKSNKSSKDKSNNDHSQDIQVIKNYKEDDKKSDDTDKK